MSKDTAQLLKKIESLYLEKNYDEAIDLLLSNKAELGPGLFHYNLGSIYLKKGELGAARFQLEKALDQGFTHPAIFSNLRGLKNHPGLKELRVDQSLGEKVTEGLLSLPSSYFLGLSLLLTIILLLCYRLKKLQKWPAIIALFIISWIPVAINYIYIDQLNEAVVLEESRVFEGPSKIYEDLGILPAGSKVVIGDISNDWYFIEYPKSVSGWISGKALGFL
jgi:tetratricopeptide (TPR) repeat protein